MLEASILSIVRIWSCYFSTPRLILTGTRDGLFVQADDTCNSKVLVQTQAGTQT